MVARPKTISEQQLIREAIRDAGLRATGSRIAVLGLLRRENAALSHGEVAEMLTSEPSDRATIYRNLIDLTEVGLVKRMELGDHTWRFEAVDDEHADSEHPHFVCTDCGTVECLPEMTVMAAKGDVVPRSVRASQVEVQLRGVCNDCD